MMPTPGAIAHIRHEFDRAARHLARMRQVERVVGPLRQLDGISPGVLARFAYTAAPDLHPVRKV